MYLCRALRAWALPLARASGARACSGAGVVSYTQGQSPAPRTREYFYYVDHQGQVGRGCRGPLRGRAGRAGGSVRPASACELWPSARETRTRVLAQEGWWSRPGCQLHTCLHLAPQFLPTFGLQSRAAPPALEALAGAVATPRRKPVR